MQLQGLRRDFMLRLAAASAVLHPSLAALAAPHNSASVGKPPQLGTILYPISDSETEDSSYFFSLFKLALEKQQASYTLQKVTISMRQNRTLTELAAGRGMSIVVTMTSKEREQLLRPVRVPLDKGLFGWRIFLIRKESQALFSKIHQLADLKKYTAGQGRGWPDAEILQANGLPLFTSATSPQLQKMLSAGRIDYLPLSILEVWPDLQDQQEQQDRLTGGITVESHLILHYPTAFYFFVHKDNQVLAETLEAGLRQAWLDGSADKLFQRFYGQLIQRAKMGERTKIALHNPLLPVETPLEFLWSAKNTKSKSKA